MKNTESTTLKVPVPSILPSSKYIEVNFNPLEIYLCKILTVSLAVTINNIVKKPSYFGAYCLSISEKLNICIICLLAFYKGLHLIKGTVFHSHTYWLKTLQVVPQKLSASERS